MKFHQNISIHCKVINVKHKMANKVISLASVRISHTSLRTRIINPQCRSLAKVTKIHGFIFGICDFYAALAYSISASPLALTLGVLCITKKKSH